MSSNLLRPDLPDAAPDRGMEHLSALRAELDRLDDATHDTLMRRSEVVVSIGSLPVKGRVALRPGREAAIIRRLLARHHGAMPPFALVRIWREMICGFTAQQRPMLISVCEPEGRAAYTAVAREHFGALAPLRAYRTPAQAIAEVSSGAATAAVLPMPSDGEPPGIAWWTALLHRDDPRIHIAARLPFWAPRPEGAPRAQALLVSAAPPDPSGADRSLLGFEVSPESSRARLSAALATSGFTMGPLILQRGPGDPVARALADVDGFVTDDDPRLAGLATVLRRPVVLGAYAVPLQGPAA